MRLQPITCRSIAGFVTIHRQKCNPLQPSPLSVINPQNLTTVTISTIVLQMIRALNVTQKTDDTLKD